MDQICLPNHVCLTNRQQAWLQSLRFFSVEKTAVSTVLAQGKKMPLFLNNEKLKYRISSRPLFQIYVLKGLRTLASRSNFGLCQKRHKVFQVWCVYCIHLSHLLAAYETLKRKLKGYKYSKEVKVSNFSSTIHVWRGK